MIDNVKKNTYNDINKQKMEGVFMTIEEKEKILKNIFDKTDIIEKEDKEVIIAYIRGTVDTRERMKMKEQIITRKIKEI